LNQVRGGGYPAANFTQSSESSAHLPVHHSRDIGYSPGLTCYGGIRVLLLFQERTPDPAGIRGQSLNLIKPQILRRWDLNKRAILPVASTIEILPC
jgi:hypothetical protein